MTNAEHNKKQTALLRDAIRSAKQKPCQDCKKEFPYFVMDFDHVRGTKNGNIADYPTRKVSIITLMTEIDKCEIVCSNCHRLRTFKRYAKL